MRLVAALVKLGLAALIFQFAGQWMTRPDVTGGWNGTSAHLALGAATYIAAALLAWSAVTGLAGKKKGKRR